MNGCAIPYTPIAVNFWKVRQLQRVHLFFLSHAHLEPSCGITASWSTPIYCSLISKKILLQRFQLNQNVVHALELNIPHVIPLTCNKDVTMAVTLIDANHCPGSVMFLFEGYFGRILYTGDFRFTEEMLTTLPFNSVIEKPIDVLYMDNTYCSPKCNFPAREVTRQEIIAAIEQHPTEKVVIGLRNLGKEDLLLAIASHFNVTIKVTEERYKTLKLLNICEQFSTIDTDNRIEAVQMVDVTRQNMDIRNKAEATIAILPTAIFTALGDFPFHRQRDVIVVPYSDHSSYLELQRFVAAVKPKSIIPIVKADVRDPLTAALLDRTNFECFLEHLDKTPMTNYHIPPSVLESMNQKLFHGRTNHKTNIGRKTSFNAKILKANAKNRRNNENTDRANSRTSCTHLPLEHKSEALVDVNISVASRGQKRGLEKSGTDIDLLSKDTDFQECPPVTKLRRFGSNLSRCASSDRLYSPFHQSGMKLRSNRVSSPDLRLHLKYRVGIDVRRSYSGLYSNLIRTRRVRLCNAHLCRTFCHSSKHCKSNLNDNIYRTETPRNSILELDNGKETLFNFANDVLETFYLWPKECIKNSDGDGSSLLIDMDREMIYNKQIEQEFVFPMTSSMPLVCPSSVVYDTSDSLVNMSPFLDNITSLVDATDLRYKGQGANEYPTNGMISSTSETCAHDDLEGTVLTQSNQKETEDSVFNSSKVSLPGASASSYCNAIDSISSSLVSSTCAPVSWVEHLEDFCSKSFLFQAQHDREPVHENLTDHVDKFSWVSNSEGLFLKTGFSGMLAANSLSNICDQTPRHLQREHCLTTTEISKLNRVTHKNSEQSNLSSLTNVFTSSIVSRASFDCPAVLTPFDSTLNEANKFDVEQSIFVQKGAQQSLLHSGGNRMDSSNYDNHVSGKDHVGGKDSVELTETDTKRLSVDACFLTSRSRSSKTNLQNIETEVKVCDNGRITPHAGNTASENALPPKKNWRQRFGMLNSENSKDLKVKRLEGFMAASNLL